MKTSIVALISVLKAIPTVSPRPTEDRTLTHLREVRDQLCPVATFYLLDATQRDLFELWGSLPRDLSGHGSTQLGADGVLRTRNSAREIVGEVKLTKHEVASFLARSATPITAGLAKPGFSNVILEARDCIDYPCDEDEDCNAECVHGCWYQDPPGYYRCM